MQYPKPTYQFVSPIGTTGKPAIDPTRFQVTAAIPHLNTLEEIKAAIGLIRRQTVSCYIIVVDTGSPPEVCAALEQMRSDDLEIHYLAGNGYDHSSEPVALALDVAQQRCRTRHLFHTHADCFLRRRDFVDFLLRITNASTPAVGYRMSPRDPFTKEWEWMIGHTATMLYMPTIHRIRASWTMRHMFYAYGYAWENQGGWPDTETGFNRILRDAGIVPVFIGNDRNGERQTDDNIDHVRSFCGSKVDPTSEYHRQAVVWMASALEDAAARAKEWDLQIAAEALHG